MALNISDVINKLLDNANVGKAVTDVGSGFALAISFVLGVGLVTGISVIPMDRSKPLTAQRAQQFQVLCEQKAELAALLDGAAEILKLDKTQTTPRCSDLNSTPTTPDAQKRSDDAIRAADELYRISQRRIAALAAQIATFDDRLTALQKAAAADTKTMDAVLAAKEPYAKVHDQLVNQKELIDTQQQRVTTLENQLSDARSFTANIEGFTNNISALLAFSVVLGVIISQLNRLVLVNWIFESILSRDHKPREIKNVNKEAKDDLVTNYYRYVEGSINMIVPVIAFGIVVPRFIDARLEPVSAAVQWMSFLTGVIIAALLAISGFLTYKTYRQKEALLQTESRIS
jgi:hypothetical protein